jgi:hypothetical protein
MRHTVIFCLLFFVSRKLLFAHIIHTIIFCLFFYTSSPKLFWFNVSTKILFAHIRKIRHITIFCLFCKHSCWNFLYTIAK